MNSKKAQIQMTETIVVLIAFFFIMMIGASFFVVFMKDRIKQQGEENQELDAAVIMKRFLALPEVQCTKNAHVEPSCIDTLKLQSAANLVSANDLHYFDTLGFSKITVTSIYPDQSELVFYDRPIEDYTLLRVTQVPISLEDPVSKAYGFGIIEIIYYAR